MSVVAGGTKVMDGCAGLYVHVRTTQFKVTIWRFNRDNGSGWDVDVRTLTPVAGVHLQEGTVARTWAEAYRRALRIAERLASRRRR